MREGCNAFALVAGGILLAAEICAQNNDFPVGLILSAPSARITRRNQPEIGVAGGELLFAGDKIRARSQAATFILCPAGKAPMRQSIAAGGEVTVGRDRVAGATTKLNAPGEIPICRLPEVIAEPEIISKGDEDLTSRTSDPAAYAQRVSGLGEDARKELSTLDAALRANPRDMVAMTSRATLLQKNGLAAEAADQYATIAGAWKSQQWAKMLVHDNSRAAAPARSGSGTTYAVVIGISSYDNRGIHDLQFAHMDAIRFAEYLSKARGRSVPPENVKLLVNRAATLAEIDKRIKFLTTQKLGKDDTMVIFISGHGDVSEGEGYVIPNRADPHNLKESAYPMAALFALMHEMSAKVGRFELFVDACRAGMIGQITEKNAINLKLAKAVKEGADNVTALLASKQTELAFEHPNFGFGEGHSAFSYFLLRGMAADGVREADFDGDGKVSLGELSQYVQDKVIEATQRRQHPVDISRVRNVEQEEVANLGREGIKLPLKWEPMPKSAFSTKGLAPAAPPYELEEPPVPADEVDLERLIRLEEQGQEIMLRYLLGDEIPQTRNDFKNGWDLYQEALKLAPGSLFLESRKEFFHGRMLVFDKQYDDAIGHLENAIRLNPRSPSTYNALGIAYLELGRYAEAIAAFESAMARAWYWPYPRHNLALAYMQMGRYDPAILAYRKAIQLAPDYSYLPYNLGLIYQKLNRRRDAEDAYLEAQRLANLRARQATSPDLAEAYAERTVVPLIALALLKADDGRSSQAVKDYNTVLDMLAPYPGNRNVLIARHDLALLLAKKKETWSDAEGLLTKNLEAGYVPSRQRMAEWLVERGRPADAVQHFEALLADKPEYTAARLQLAEILDKLGDAGRERIQLEIARRNDPANVQVLLSLARLESAGKRWDAAREAYRAALENALDPKLRRQIGVALKRLP
jgi:tetratricopeptide (TPR) repeat protein